MNDQIMAVISGDLFVAIENGDVAAAEKLVPFINEPTLFSLLMNAAAMRGYVSILQIAMQSSMKNITMCGSSALLLAVEEGQLDVVKLFLKDARIEASSANNRALIKAAEVAKYIFLNKNDAKARFVGLDSERRRFDIVDLLYRQPSVYHSIEYEQVLFYHLQMFRSRMLEICIALQSLYLPDLQTLKIIDSVIFNCVRRFAKIELIRTVKHFKF